MYNIISNLQTREDILNEYEKIKWEYYLKIKNYNKKSIGVRKIGHINFIKNL